MKRPDGISGNGEGGEKLMDNEKLLVDKSHVKILKQMIDDYKNSEDKFIGGIGKGMETVLEFLMEAKS